MKTVTKPTLLQQEKEWEMSSQKSMPQPPKDLCRVLFETAGEAILVIQEDYIVDCNTRAGIILNSSPNQLLGRTLYDLLPPTSPEGRALKELWPESVKAALAGEQPRFAWYLSQSVTWIELVLNALKFQKEIFIQVLIHDITPYKRVEDQLVQERRLLQQVVDHLPAHIYVKDTEGRFVFGNLATVHSLGANSLDELIGKSDFDFSPESWLSNSMPMNKLSIERASRLFTKKMSSWTMSPMKKDGSPPPKCLCKMMVDK
jgi:PAS domain-containing protein